jgi:hypothetical protein
MYSKQMRTQIFQGLNVTKKYVKIFKNREIKAEIKAELEMIKKGKKTYNCPLNRFALTKRKNLKICNKPTELPSPHPPTIISC